jgi:hypothetical protein
MKLFVSLSILLFWSLRPVHHPAIVEKPQELSVSLKVLKPDSISILVKNINPKTITAYSHVITHEKHYDYFELEAITPDGEQLYFDFVDNRNKSAPVIVMLKPGESFSHTLNLQKWSERSINKGMLKKAGFNYLPRGIKIRAKYRNSPCDNCNHYYKSIWTGYVYSEWTPF